MIPDDELDALLADHLADTDLDGDAFTRAVATRLGRRRRVRRVIAAGVAAIVSIAVGVGMAGASAPLLPAVTITPEMTVAMLMLTALCCAVWIAAETRSISLPQFDPRRRR